jgi:hypothetical protein
MTEHEAIEQFKRLPRDRQIRTLTILAHTVTVIGRSLYNGNPSALVDADRVRAINEKLHWVCGTIVELTCGSAVDASDCLFGLISDDAALRDSCDAAVAYALDMDSEYERMTEDPEEY